MMISVVVRLASGLQTRFSRKASGQRMVSVCCPLLPACAESALKQPGQIVTKEIDLHIVEVIVIKLLFGEMDEFD